MAALHDILANPDDWLNPLLHAQCAHATETELLLHGVYYGFPILPAGKTATDIPPFEVNNYPSKDPRCEEALTESIKADLQAGLILETEEKPRHLTAIYAKVEQDGAKIRTITDYSKPEGASINDHAIYNKFRMMDHQDAYAYMKRDHFMAKVDIDANPGLAQQFQVLSIPAVKAFRNGEVVEEFVGLVAPAQMEAFLDQLVPSKVDLLVAEGDADSLREAIFRDAGRTDARIALAHILIDAGDTAEAEEVLAPAEHDPVAAGLRARIRLMGSQVPEIGRAHV